MKFRNILLGTLLSFTCLANVSFAKADTYSAPGTVQGSNGLAGGVDSAGHIMGSNGQITGSVDSDGRIMNSNGQVTGAIDSDGRVMNSNGQVAGAVSSDGHIMGSNGQMLGAVDSAGRVMNANGQIVGAVPPGNPAVAFGMLTGQSGNNDNGTPSLAQQEAEIRQMQQAQPVPQGQPSCFAGCITPPPSFKHKINIRTLDGSLVGWTDTRMGIELEVNALPALHLKPPIGDKYTGVNKLLLFPDYGEARKIMRLLFDQEEDRIKKSYPEIAKRIENEMYLSMGYVDQFGNITDLQGKKIAYEEIGDIVYDVNADSKIATYLRNDKFYYPNVLGIFEPNGDVRDVHNRLVGHLDESQRDDADSGQPEALKLIQKYEKQHPWHSAVHKMTKSPLK